MPLFEWLERDDPAFETHGETFSHDYGIMNGTWAVTRGQRKQSCCSRPRAT
jgi:hypothetical protein